MQAPSKLDLPVGGAITLDVALKVLIVKSANDVAVMIAETVARSEQAFVARMNEAAQHLGMTRTTFTNVNGLPDERQVTTARDLAKLARAIIVEFPEHADLFSSIQVQVGKKTMRTHNSLLVSLPGADGMKTGFICESGFNVVASATRDGRKLVRGRSRRGVSRIAQRPRDRSPREGLQALFLEIAVRHEPRSARDSSLVERQPDASAGQRVWRSQGEVEG